MYFLRGSLPWQGVRAYTKKQKYEQICVTKIGTPIEELTESFPEEFGNYLNYCKNLGFDEKPDYSLLRRMFRVLLESRGGKPETDQYDWEKLVNKEKKNTEQIICKYFFFFSFF